MEKINTLKWKDVLAQTSKELTEVSYRTWFLPLVPLEMDEEKGIMSIAVTDKFKADMFLFLAHQAASALILDATNHKHRFLVARSVRRKDTK